MARLRGWTWKPVRAGIGWVWKLDCGRVLAAERPAGRQRQGQGRRVVGIRDRELDPAGRVERGEPAEVAPGVVAVGLDQVDLVARRVVADVVGRGPLDPDGEGQREGRHDDPGPLAAAEQVAADQPSSAGPGSRMYARITLRTNARPGISIPEAFSSVVPAQPGQVGRVEPLADGDLVGGLARSRRWRCSPAVVTGWPSSSTACRVGAPEVAARGSGRRSGRGRSSGS